MITNVLRGRSAGSAAEVALHHFRGMRGGAAFLWAVAFGIVFAYAAPDTWHRDMAPTRDWFLDHPAIGGVTIATYGSTVAIAVFILLPIILNAVASELAAYLKVFFYIGLVIAFFDHYTDGPVNYRLFVADWPMPVFSETPLTWLWWAACLIATQIWYTDILEVITAASLVGFLVCLRNTFKAPGSK